jgi:hypothetical protein
MHGQHTIDAGVGERQHFFVDRDRADGPANWPGARALLTGHQGSQPQGFVRKRFKIGCGIPQAHDGQALDAWPSVADLTIDQVAHMDAHRTVIEGRQFGDVLMHSGRSRVADKIILSQPAGW